MLVCSLHIQQEIYAKDVFLGKIKSFSTIKALYGGEIKTKHIFGRKVTPGGQFMH